MQSKENTYFLYTVIALVVSVLIVAATVVQGVVSQRSYTQSVEQRAELLQTMRLLDSLLSMAKDVETARRGFLLTGDHAALAPIDNALPRILSERAEMHQLVLRGFLPESDWQLIEGKLNERVRLARESVSHYISKPEYDVTQQEFTQRGNIAMSDLRALIEDARIMTQTRYDGMLERTQVLQSRALVIDIAGGVITVLLVIASLMVLLYQTRRRTRAEAAVKDSLSNARAANAALRKRNDLAQRLNTLSNALQSCRNQEEAYAILDELLPSIFPDCNGELYFLKESKNQLERVARWGKSDDAPLLVHPDDCWALRQGKPHLAPLETKSLHCAHAAHPPGLSLCMPLQSIGETHGMMHFDLGEQQEMSNADMIHTTSCVEQISISLGNILLREQLRTQAIRDPLTGLFNRRYVIESALREIHRASRNANSPIAIAMIDIDHFKKFNDTYGHDAGDHVIKTLAAVLKKFVRGDDIASRYGGEEFLLLLPGASLEHAHARLQELCAQVREMPLHFNGASLGQITLSVGLAAFPKHGDDFDHLTKHADLALYQAKQNGRNQVQIAPANAAIA